MSQDKRAIVKQWLSSGKVGLHPLTFPQREIWETSPVPPGDAANHICSVIDVKGTMTLPLAMAALQRVVDRQDVLRLSILPGKEGPIQMIRQTADANLAFHGVTESPRQEQAVEDLALALFNEPFDLLQGPLYRAALVRLSTVDHVLLLAIHHAIADGWSLGVFVQDLCLGYAQELMGTRDRLPALAKTYAAWGAAEREYWQPAEIEKRTAYWKPALAGTPRFWPAEEGPATAAGRHERWVTNLPAEVAQAAQSLARTTGATLYSTLLAVFQAALFRWTGQADIVVGTPIANRTVQDVRETMGYVAGVVPLRFQLDAERKFSDGLRALQQTTLECFSNAMPFAELARALGDPGAPGHNPLFEIRFALQNHPMPDVSLHGLSGKLKMRSTGTARFHLGCEITLNSGGLEVVWLFRPKLFPKVEIEDLAGIFTSMLESACRAPDSRIANLMN